MPENREELFSIIYEFDSQVRAIDKMIEDYDKDDLTNFDKNLLKAYRNILGLLKDEYDHVDRMLAFQMKWGVRA